MLAAYFNMLQRELVGVVEGSDIELSSEDAGQLLKAIKKQAESVAPVASQAEALVTDEAAANNTKRMTPLRVLQAIKARLVNASETVVGMLRVATQNEVNSGTDGAISVTPKTLAGIALGVAQTWKDLTTSRAGNTTYTNTTGRPIQLSILGRTNASGTASSYSFLINGAVVMNDATSAHFSTAMINVIVPAGATYRFVLGANTILYSWAELSI